MFLVPKMYVQSRILVYFQNKIVKIPFRLDKHVLDLINKKIRNLVLVFMWEWIQMTFPYIRPMWYDRLTYLVIDKKPYIYLICKFSIILSFLS